MIAKNISAETTDSLKLYVPTLHLLRFSFLLGSVLKFLLGLGKHHVWPDLLRSPHTRLESSQICWKISSVFILTNATTQRQTSVSCLASVCHTLHLLLWKSFKRVLCMFCTNVRTKPLPCQALTHLWFAEMMRANVLSRGLGQFLR